MTADRPATEPRTERGRYMAASFRSYGATFPFTEADILAIEDEAAQGAAPRHKAEQDQRMAMADGISRCVCGRTIAEVGTIRDRRWLHVEEPWNEGAAPRAEGLDVLAIRGESDHALEALRHLFWIMERLDKQAGPPFSHDHNVKITSETWLDLVRPAIRTVQSRLFRPSDEEEGTARICKRFRHDEHCIDEPHA